MANFPDKNTATPYYTDLKVWLSGNIFVFYPLLSRFDSHACNWEIFISFIQILL
jgi:hypothetical protein